IGRSSMILPSRSAKAAGSRPARMVRRRALPCIRRSSGRLRAFRNGSGPPPDVVPPARRRDCPMRLLTDAERLPSRRAVASLLCGAAGLAVALLAGARPSVAGLVAWDTAALVFVGWVLLTVRGKDADATARTAGAEDDSPIVSEVVLLAAGTFSLV